MSGKPNAAALAVLARFKAGDPAEQGETLAVLVAAERRDSVRHALDALAIELTEMEWDCPIDRGEVLEIVERYRQEALG